MKKIKKIVVNTDLINKYFPTSKTVGEYTFELKSFKEISGHNDSLPFQAKLYINGKEAAIAHNDGWGGETVISPTKEAAYKTVYTVERYLKEHKEPSCKMYGMQFYWDTIQYICDHLADNCFVKAQIARDARRKIVIYHPKNKKLLSVTINGMGKRTIQELMTNPAFRKVWDNITKKYEERGYVVLNNQEAQTSPDN